MKLMRNALLVTAAALLVSGCGGGQDKKPKTPTVGKRVPVLTAESSVEVDPALADVAVVVPAPLANPNWTQPGGSASKTMGHLALGSSLTRAWSARIEGSSKSARLASGPVVADGKLYAVDSRAKLHAFNAESGAKLWTVQIGQQKDAEGGRSWLSGELKGNVGLLFGGGVSYDAGTLYATNGMGDVAAFNAETGAQLWMKRPGGPLRGAPGVGNGNVYVMSQDNQLFALRQSDGNLEWSRAGTLETAGVFGVASPAIAQGTVVTGYSSGELSAYRYENGQEVWQDALARTSISISVARISDIDADPVIDQGRVFAVGQGGRMVSLELVTGQRLWEINLAGIQTPWVVGEWLFVVTDESKLLCLSRVSGKVKWESQLPRYRKVKKKEGPIAWQGPVLAGNRLILVSNGGHMVEVSPTDGKIQRDVELKEEVTVPPIVANNTLYILDDSGTLTAWR